MEIVLIENQMTATPDDYMAIVQDAVSNGRDEIIKEITGPGSILKDTECNAVLSAYFNQLVENLEKGIGYRDEYITISPTVQGVFNSEDDRFDQVRHSIYPNISPGAILKEAVKKIKVTTVEGSERRPVIKELYDILSGTSNERITKGGVIELYGDFLKVDTTDENQGIFLENPADGTEIKLDRIHNNFPKKLSVIVPADLAAGSYRLKVKASLPSTKSVRTGTLDATILVE